MCAVAVVAVSLSVSQEILHIFVQIASALQYCHMHKIVHRDLKSQNIFLTQGNKVHALAGRAASATVRTCGVLR